MTILLNNKCIIDNFTKFDNFIEIENQTKSDKWQVTIQILGKQCDAFVNMSNLLLLGTCILVIAIVIVIVILILIAKAIMIVIAIAMAIIIIVIVVVGIVV